MTSNAKLADAQGYAAGYAAGQRDMQERAWAVHDHAASRPDLDNATSALHANAALVIRALPIIEQEKEPPA